MDLCKAAKELEKALCKVKGMRDKWNTIKMEAVKFALKVGVSFTFTFKRVGRVPRFFDEFASDTRPQDPEERFRAVARALIGGVYIHIFVLCPTDFF